MAKMDEKKTVRCVLRQKQCNEPHDGRQRFVYMRRMRTAVYEYVDENLTPAAEPSRTQSGLPAGASKARGSRPISTKHCRAGEGKYRPVVAVYNHYKGFCTVPERGRAAEEQHSSHRIPRLRQGRLLPRPWQGIGCAFCIGTPPTLTRTDTWERMWRTSASCCSGPTSTWRARTGHHLYRRWIRSPETREHFINGTSPARACSRPF